MVDAPAPRPYFIPKGLDFEALPEEIKLAVREIVNPAYRELVLGASDALERAAGATFVHLAWLELLDQLGLGEQVAAGLPGGGVVGDLVHEEDLQNHLRLLGAKQKAAAFLLRLREFRTRQRFSAGPWPGMPLGTSEGARGDASDPFPEG